MTYAERKMLTMLIGDHKFDAFNFTYKDSYASSICHFMDNLQYEWDQAGLLDWVGLAFFPIIQTILLGLFTIYFALSFVLIGFLVALPWVIFGKENVSFIIPFLICLFVVPVFVPILLMMSVIEILDTCFRYGLGVPLAYVLSGIEPINSSESLSDDGEDDQWVPVVVVEQGGAGNERDPVLPCF